VQPRPLRVAFVASELFPQLGGVQRYTAAVLEQLSRRHVVGLIAEPGQRLPTPAPVDDIARIRLARPESPEQLAESVERLADALADFRPHVVHLASAGLGVYRAALPGATPCLVTLHGNDFAAPWQEIPGASVRSAVIANLNHCQALVAVSRHTAALARRLGVTAMITVLPPGCDVQRFEPSQRDGVLRRLGLPDDLPILLTVSRLAPRKGHASILRALEMTRRPYHWVVVGDGPGRAALTRAIGASRVSERCSVLGAVSEVELLQLYQACDVFVGAPEDRQTAESVDSEGFGLVFHEAGACGKPVLATTAGGVPEAVIHGRTGILVAPRAPHLLADGLTSFLADEQLRRRVGDAGRRHVSAAGGWALVASSLDAMYRRLCD
jgi:phosphatidyl-myo-inositol dimannoside synthase